MRKKILFIALGAGVGFAYYYFIGCNNGSCLIQSNPYISSTYGAAMGWAISTVIFPQKKDSDSFTDNEKSH